MVGCVLSGSCFATFYSGRGLRPLPPNLPGLFGALVIIMGEERCKHSIRSIIHPAARVLVDLVLTKKTVKLTVLGVSHWPASSSAMARRLSLISTIFCSGKA